MWLSVRVAIIWYVTGKVIEHEFRYRAQRARIDALIPARGHESSRPWALRRGIDADHALLLDPWQPGTRYV